MSIANEKSQNELSFDEKKMDQLVQLGKDLDEDVVQQLLRLHFETSENQLIEIHNYFESNNLAQIKAEAHKLKSSCGTLGLNKLHRLCSELELYMNQATEKNLMSVHVFIEDIISEYKYSKNLLLNFQIKTGLHDK